MSNDNACIVDLLQFKVFYSKLKKDTFLRTFCLTFSLCNHSQDLTPFKQIRFDTQFLNDFIYIP